MKIYVLFFLSLLIFSCNQDNKAQENADLVVADAATAPPTALTEALEQSTDTTLLTHSQGGSSLKYKSKLIRTADYRFKVDDLNRTTSSIESLIEKFPAYISSSRLTNDSYEATSLMTIRVQAEYFEDALKAIDKFSVHTDKREVVTTNVGKEYVDLESRLKTKREVEKRYMDILRKNTGTIEEILAAERQIGEIHEEIEATISRMNYLKEQVAYSTIQLEMYEPIDAPLIAESIPLLTQFKSAFVSGFDGCVKVLIGLTYLWPMLVIAIGGLYLYKFRRRRSTNAG